MLTSKIVNVNSISEFLVLSAAQGHGATLATGPEEQMFIGSLTRPSSLLFSSLLFF